MCAHVSFTRSQYSLCILYSMHRCPRDRLYTLSYPRTSNRTHFFPRKLIFSDTYIIEWYNFQTQPGCISSWWWNESFLTMTSASRFAVPPGNICPVRSRTDASFPPLEISYNTSPVLPISPGCLQGLPYISHTSCPNLNYVYYNSAVARRCFQNQYLIGHRICPTWKIDMQHLESAVWGTASSFAWGGQRQLWV